MPSAPHQPILADVDALGVHVAIHLRDAAHTAGLEAAQAAWRDSAVSADRASAERTVRVPFSVEDGVEGALSDLSTRVTLAALDALRGSRLLLHAAGVATPDGRVLAMVGPSGRGKTTASRHLGTRFGYVSDESVAVDQTLSVWPYRKPLSVIVGGKPVKEQIAPSDLGLLPLSGAPLRLAGITLLERDPETSEPGPTAVDLIDAICEMTPQISYLPELPSPLQYIARIIDRIGPVTRLVYRDAADLPDMVEDMLASLPAAPQTWTAAPPPDRAGSWRCAAVDDAILVEGRACLLRDGVVVALDHRGCLVWTKCLEGASIETITAAAIAAFGDPGNGNPRVLIEQTLLELAEHGLVERA
jgi:hypothetical protein